MDNPLFYSIVIKRILIINKDSKKIRVKLD